jgi:putative GTP pyrophosphokinase
MHNLTELFENKRSYYENCMVIISQQLEAKVKDYKLTTHKVEKRIKTSDSLETKIITKNEKYTELPEITDLIGLRIITFYEEDVDQIAEMVKNEFEIDYKNSIDKRYLETDRFGYRSLHYVASLKKGDSLLIEDPDIYNVKFEIQIRSVLQHTWAEIEHNLGYKSKISVPPKFLRNFYQIAALLELADEGFVRLRRDLRLHEEEMSDKIENSTEEIPLDLSSFKTFIDTNQFVSEIDSNLADKYGITLVELNGRSIEGYLTSLKFVGMNTIQELQINLVENKDEILLFGRGWLSRRGYEVTLLVKGISIFYLVYVLIGKKNDPQLTRKYFIDILGLTELRADKYIQSFNETWLNRKNY